MVQIEASSTTECHNGVQSQGGHKQNHEQKHEQNHDSWTMSQTINQLTINEGLTLSNRPSGLVGSLNLLGFGWGWAQELGTKGQGLTILVKMVNWLLLLGWIN